MKKTFTDLDTCLAVCYGVTMTDHKAKAEENLEEARHARYNGDASIYTDMAQVHALLHLAEVLQAQSTPKE